MARAVIRRWLVLEITRTPWFRYQLPAAGPFCSRRHASRVCARLFRDRAIIPPGVPVWYTVAKRSP